jgi:hypothetical protein
VKPETAARLAHKQIELVSETPGHCCFTRGNFVALVERSGAGFGSIGSTGIMTESGLAYLVWRNGRALLKGKATETEANPERVEAIRQFSDDLKEALVGEE